MAKVIDKGDWITKVVPCLRVDYEFGWGGNSHFLNIGEMVTVLTKYGTRYSGRVRGFETATKEGMQDCFLIENQEGKLHKVGMYDITEMETPE